MKKDKCRFIAETPEIMHMDGFEMKERTDKELSMEFVLDYSKVEKGELLTTMDLQNAFLARLKTGRLKWHDLRKDSNDVPFQEKNKKWHIVLDNFGNKCFYDNIINKWRRLETLDIIEPTAWCEVPKYTEE